MPKKLAPEIRKLKIAYRDQRSHAAQRGVAFLLTFEQWLKIWTDSGRLSQRGYCKGQYQMARFKDKGAYVLDNVKIITIEDNLLERVFTEETRRKLSVALRGNKHTLGRTPSAATRLKLSKALTGRTVNEATKRKQSLSRTGKALSEETKRRIGVAKLGKKYHLGHKHSNEAKAKISASLRLNWARRKKSCEDAQA